MIKEEDKPFRISARRVLLTYSQVDAQMSAIDLLEILQQKSQLRRCGYVISKEFHQKGESHFHAVFISQNKFNIINKNALDVEHEGQTFHGNYQPVRDLQGAIEYVCKDKEYITNLPNLVDGKLLNEKEFLVKQVEEKGATTALLEYTRNHPEKAFSSRSISALKKNFKDVQEMENSLDEEALESPFNMQNFDLQGKLKAWVDNPNLHKKKALILVGRSGIGKTEFGKAFCIDKQLKTLVVNHKEDFQRINKTHDAVIIDDANVAEFEDTQLLALLDNDNARTIRVLYQTVKKKKGVVMILLMNHAQFGGISQTLKQGAFLRRAVVHEPQQPFIVNVNINIHNGDIHNNYNQKQTFVQHQKEEQKFMQENYEDICAIEQRYELEKNERKQK